VAAAASLIPVEGAQQQQQIQYIVGPNDVLAITVYDQPQLSGRYIVQPDGTLTFPLLGQVEVGGLSVQAIETVMRDRLARGYLKNPQVGVAVDQYRSQQILILGEVRQPGNLEFTGAMTVVEALARAGSTTERAGLTAVIVRTPRGGVHDGKTEQGDRSKYSETIRVDLEGLQAGERTQNVTLRGGDTIFIPRAESVFVSGHVRSAGEYAIRQGMTVREVLTLAGGVTEVGSTRRIQIIRKVEGKERTIGASLQDLVQAGDTIVVRERFF
jgi:polysaccharide export outer membrane protein